MSMPKRIALVEASGLKSCYLKKSKRLDISTFNNVGQRGNFIHPFMFSALLKLEGEVRQAGGDFYIIDLFRSWDTQAAARAAYEKNKKKAYVARAGGSFHTAGRAVDFSVQELHFENIEKEKWLEKFWELAIPLGFNPIIKYPDMHMSENWHLDYMGDNTWKNAYKNLPYERVAKCCILDVGEWDKKEDEEKVKKMFIQAQLIRLGNYNVGEVDGIFGPKTNWVLEHYGLHVKGVDEIIEALIKE